eukprot:TRINITY_DN7367_c0_g1_i1.p1 TRINITY_DN7367_c0_g1~~TRINITY_DN7367_c0_g1_i1.p1  ORF type:complete len:348 (+),score=101.86 TRINITY_DN7367_c0_g1_i1:98-1045(+)
MAEVGEDDLAATVYMALVSLQVGLQPLLTQRCATGVSKESLVLAENALKILCSLAIVPGGTLVSWSVSESMRIVAAPACVYALSGLMKLHSYRHCDGVTFNLVNQTKLVFSAVCVWLLLGRGQTTVQMGALLVISVAAAVLSWPQQSRSSSSENAAAADSERRRVLHGVLPGLGAAALSGVAASLCQLALQGEKRQPDLFNMELALWGSTALVVTGQLGSWNAGRAGGRAGGLFSGWRLQCALPPLAQALGGIGVGRVIQLRGSVTMCLCTVVGIVIAAVAKWLFAREPLSVAQWVAAAMVIPGVLVHTGAVSLV